MYPKEMGFSKTQSEIAIKNHGNVQVALESMCLHTKGAKSNESCSDMDHNESESIENDSENGDDNGKKRNQC